MEGLGYGCRDNGLNLALNGHLWTVQLPIVQAGSDTIKQKYLPRMARGDLISAHAITEQQSGSDVYAMEMTAERCEGGYRLNGTKKYITLGPVADIVLCFAKTDPSAGKWGISAFLVESTSPGFHAGPMQHKMGLRTVPIGDLFFENCFVSEENRLGAEGAGVSLSTSFLEWERCCILASQLGAMQRQLEECTAFVRKRKQFGKSVGKYQAVANRIVDMKLRLDTSRLILWQAAWLKSQGRSAMTEMALAKLHLSESFAQSSMDAIRLHGALGYMTDTGVERDLRDAVGATIYAGTSDIQKNIVAGMLGL